MKVFDSEFSEASSRATLFESHMDSDEPTLLAHDFDDSDEEGDEDLSDNGDDHEQPEMQDIQSETTTVAPAEFTRGVSGSVAADNLTQLDDVEMCIKATDSIASSQKPPEPAETTPDRTRFTIIVRDVAYSTYYAILYYVRPFC